MKKNTAAYSLVAMIVVFISYRFYFRSKEIQLPKYGSYLSCIGNPFDLKARHSSYVYLVKELIPKNEKDRSYLFLSAVYYQNLYAFMNALEHNPNSPLKWISMAPGLPKVTIHRTEDIPYPQTIEFDQEPNVSGFPPEATVYLKKLFARGKVSKGEPALKLHYTIETNLYTCFTETTTASLKDLKFFLPDDAYLTYFYVPKPHRLLIKNTRRLNASEVVNPCMNPSGITASRFNPLGFHTFWRPEAKGHSADKIPFDCNLFYRLNENMQAPRISFEEAPPLKTNYFDFGKLRALNRPIKMALLMGGQETDLFPKMDPEKIKRDIDIFLTEEDIGEIRKKLPKSEDATFIKALILLYKFRGHIQFHSREIRTTELTVSVILRGKFKLSKRDIELRISLSPNKPGVSGADFFSQNVYENLLTNDIVVYEGHSGGGVMLDEGLERLRKDNYRNQDRSIRYQLLALYSCSSTLYYRPENFPLIQSPGFKRDVLRTGGAYLDQAGNASLAIAASVDQYLYNESYVPFAFWAKTYKSDNFYILTNISGP